MRDIKGKAALVTGGASGIGLGIAEALLDEGAQVAILDWNERHLDEAREKLAGVNAVLFLRSDVSDRARLRRSVDEAVGAFGGIDILCNNAGVAAGGAVDDPDFDDWDRCLAINFGGVVNGVKIVAPLMKERGAGGHIVNTASMAALIALPDGAGCYATGKFAVRGFTESLRLTLAPSGIGVSCLCPGLTRSRIMKGIGANPDHETMPTGEIEQLFDTMEGAMEPIEVGRMVIEGIRENRPYIFTHGELRDEVATDMAALLALFPKDQVAPPQRLAIEAQRRAVTEERKAIRID